MKKTPHEVISKIVYLIQGKLRPDFEGVELGVAEKLAIRAISKSSGIAIKKIEEEYTQRRRFGTCSSYNSRTKDTNNISNGKYHGRKSI